MRGSGKTLGCLIKIIVVVILILALALVILQCSGGSCIRKIDNTLPNIQKAPWEVITPTHLYYATEVVENDTAVIMSGWYEHIGDKWKKQPEDITLERSFYGRIDVKKRLAE